LFSVGLHVISAAYSGDANYLAPPAAGLTLTVSKAATTTVVSADTAQLAQPFNIYASVSLGSGAGSGAGSAGGTVDFLYAGQPIVPCMGLFPSMAPDGVARCTASFPKLGAYTVTVRYNGDANTQPSSASMAIAVMKAVPGVYLTASLASPVFGAPVTLGALVIGAAGVPAPGGAVTWSDSGRTLGPISIGGDGHASIVTALSTGNHFVTATYNGDANYQAANAQPSSIVVGKASTLTALTALAGGPFTAAVSVLAPGAGTPTGNVQFFNGATLIGSAPLSAQGSAILPTATATGTMSAIYSGDANFAGSSSAAVAVSPVQVQITLTGDPNPSAAGQSVAFTAAVAVLPRAVSGPPGGAVAFTIDGAAAATSPVSAGQAVFRASLAAGTHSIVARYTGDANYPAAAASLTQIVSKAPVSTSLALVSGALTAVVHGAAGTPTGSIRFFDPVTSAAFGTVALSGGAASLPLPPIVDIVAAAYSGDDNFLPGVSAALPLLSVVNAASYVSGSLAPDELVTLFGPDLAGPDPVGTTVTIRDAAGASRFASLLYLSPEQAAALLPSDVAPGPATVTLTSPLRTLSLAVDVAPVAPGLFTADSSGKGAPAGQVIVVHADGSQDDPRPAASPIVWSDAASTVILVLYGTGLRHASAAPVCTIAGQPAAVVYSGPQPALPGLDQVNIQLPPSLRGAGEVVLTLAVDGRQANPVTLSFVTP
jgi:uncharacterized protein (TIGR03437 family)